MNVYILQANYADGSSEDIFASTDFVLFEDAKSQMDAQLNRRLTSILLNLSNIAGRHFAKEPSSFTTREVPILQIPVTLSRREREIAEEISKGTSPANIAALLGISVKTISTYRARVLEKLNVKSNAEIALTLRARGLA